MKKLLLLLPLLLLTGCSDKAQSYVGYPSQDIHLKTETHLYCYRTDSLFCDECEHYSEMDLTKDNIISVNMTVMNFPDIYTTGVKHYHYCVVEIK